jgi:manganese/zinc/iron transport system permease protein
MVSFFDFFTDPILRAPTIGSMLMCLSSALVGVVAFIRKRSLIGEALAHAAYPGVVLSIIVAAAFFPHSDEWLALLVLAGAFLFAVLGLLMIDWMHKRLRVPGDAALCFVLSSFFGVGVLIASRLQTTHLLWYKQIQVFLYGQAATMTDVHSVIYCILALVTISVMVFFYHPIQAMSFDRDFAHASGIRIPFFELFTTLLLILSIVIGIRSVGVVLMSGMVIAPAVAARQWTHRLPLLFVLAGLFGLASGFFGNYFSLKFPLWMNHPHFSFPTGPMILLSASSICLISLLFAPRLGLCHRCLRIARFRDRRLQENILKTFWKRERGASLSFTEIMKRHSLSWISVGVLLWRLRRQGWVVNGREGYLLTEDGWRRAQRVVRLHRLWEVYLVDYLGQQAQKVHQNAEEMEHILTPELERELTELLADPKQDPHSQPIPTQEGLMGVHG